MKNTYGNLYYDIQLLTEIYKLTHRIALDDELAMRKYSELKDKLGQDLNNLKEYSTLTTDTIAKFQINSSIRDIERLLTIFSLTEQEEIYLRKCAYRVSNAIYATKDAESKKKALALINFTVNKIFNNDYDLFSRHFTSIWIACANVDINESLIFNTSLEESVVKLLEGLTPDDVLQIFPSEKKYDGYKLEIKDYFSCLNRINQIGMNTKMTTEQVHDFIMECVSDGFLFDVGVGIMSNVSDFNNWDINDIITILDDLNKPKLTLVK